MLFNFGNRSTDIAAPRCKLMKPVHIFSVCCSVFDKRDINCEYAQTRRFSRNQNSGCIHERIDKIEVHISRHNDHVQWFSFELKYLLAHPGNYLFSLSYKNIFWIKVSKKYFI